MNKLNMTAIAAAIGLVFSAGAMAQNMSKDAYKAADDLIAAEYTTDKAKCDPLSGNPKDICIAEAKGKEKVAKAELEARYEPTAKNHYKALVAKAEADYAVANQKCDDKSGNDKDVCVKEAKAVKTRIEADAEAQMKTSDANRAASEKSAEAGMKARVEGAEARQEATTEKVDANYAVAKEKCDSLASDAKTRCMDEAKAKYGK
ncbi:MAG: hypothetical protein IPL59_25710 [Candidatus Competibacteraceae bacterium]|uniref:Cell envelope biogenesis protein TolA n=1 Tax=Candidatus Contendobacter odensis Run_B_J11 TaxID=1400861 RepID=A0A7U7GDE4_9GAMM|nr:hypothetical protein [Candidatus Contendobacter odensis]MBK8538184.1 hypothetical protein [Candidatus Competibacteraceae bacterium]MBK8752726.1 hypothetical protein [Candidatus Competibacteraceae bacterium]CDH46177.1 conserved exported hypothetical protein [Candidatus Contendobacter odensis Run_B_J11]